MQGSRPGVQLPGTHTFLERAHAQALRKKTAFNLLHDDRKSFIIRLASHGLQAETSDGKPEAQLHVIDKGKLSRAAIYQEKML